MAVVMRTNKRHVKVVAIRMPHAYDVSSLSFHHNLARSSRGFVRANSSSDPPTWEEHIKDEDEYTFAICNGSTSTKDERSKRGAICGM